MNEKQINNRFCLETEKDSYVSLSKQTHTCLLQLLLLCIHYTQCSFHFSYLFRLLFLTVFFIFVCTILVVILL